MSRLIVSYSGCPGTSIFASLLGLKIATDYFALYHELYLTEKKVIVLLNPMFFAKMEATKFTWMRNLELISQPFVFAEVDHACKR